MTEIYKFWRKRRKYDGNENIKIRLLNVIFTDLCNFYVAVYVTIMRNFHVTIKYELPASNEEKTI